MPGLIQSAAAQQLFFVLRWLVTFDTMQSDITENEDKLRDPPSLLLYTSALLPKCDAVAFDHKKHRRACHGRMVSFFRFSFLPNGLEDVTCSTSTAAGVLSLVTMEHWKSEPNPPHPAHTPRARSTLSINWNMHERGFGSEQQRWLEIVAHTTIEKFEHTDKWEGTASGPHLGVVWVAAAAPRHATCWHPAH